MDLHTESQRTMSEEDIERRVNARMKPAIPQLADYQHALSMHVGEALVNIDAALEMVSEETWALGTQNAVRREIGAELISGFIEGSGLEHATPRSLEREARTHLARFAIATSLLITQREMRERMGDQPCAG